MTIVVTTILVVIVIAVLFYLRVFKKLQTAILRVLARKIKSLEVSHPALDKGTLKGRLLLPVQKRATVQEPLTLLTEGPLAALFKSAHPAEIHPHTQRGHHGRNKKSSAGSDAYDWQQFIETGKLPHLNEVQKHGLYQAFHSIRYKIKEFLDAHYEDLARMGWEDIYAAVLKNYIEAKLVQLDKKNPANLNVDDIAFLERLLVLRGEESKSMGGKQPAPRNELRNRLGIWGDQAERIYQQYQDLSKRFGFNPRPRPPGPPLAS